MKRIVYVFILSFLITNLMYAGGIQTNTNQSAAWMRMLVRDASLGMDAVYFNPAGLTFLEDGFFLSLNSQSIIQNKLVTTDYQYLSNAPLTEYEGKVTAPFFPGVYTGYKTGKLVISFGFNPIGGGGGAIFEDGLPSFEYGVSELVPMLQTAGVTDYQFDTHFEGTSVFLGFQLGGSYKINDMLSVYLGGRYVLATNTYTGHLKDIMINVGGGTDYVRAQQFFLDIGNTGGAIATNNQEADVEQKGTGFSPIVGLNFNFDKLNIGFKYEGKTSIELENQNSSDVLLVGISEAAGPVYMFPAKAKTHQDMPAMVSLGASYQLSEKLSTQVGFHYYFDKDADYGRTLPDSVGAITKRHVDNADLIDHGLIEWGIGFEYQLSEKLIGSIGYLGTKTGIKPEYQTDLSYSNSSHTIGFGGQYTLNDMIAFNLGLGYTTYGDNSKTFQRLNPTNPAETIDVTETYDKDNVFIAVGIDLKF